MPAFRRKIASIRSRYFVKATGITVKLDGIAAEDIIGDIAILAKTMDMILFSLVTYLI